MIVNAEKKIALPVHGLVVQSIPFLVALTALCLSITVTTSCNFMVVEQSDKIKTMGLFSFTYSPGAELNASSKLAQAAGIIASLLGFTALVLLFLSFFLGCLQTRVTFRIVLPNLLAVAGIVQVCTFVAADQMCSCPPSFKGVNCPVTTCNPGDGANRSIAASILYIFNGILLICYPRRTTPLFDLAAVERNTAGGSDVESPTMTKGETDQGMEDMYESSILPSRLAQDAPDVPRVKETFVPYKEGETEQPSLPRGSPISGQEQINFDWEGMRESSILPHEQTPESSNGKSRQGQRQRNPSKGHHGHHRRRRKRETSREKLPSEEEGKGLLNVDA